MSTPPKKNDLPENRADLVLKAATAGERFQSAFDWINDKEELRITNNPANRGLTGKEVRELAREWIINGNPIKCVPEKRDDYKDRRHHHYDIVIPLDDFPKGLYVEMEIFDSNESDPAVNLLSAHPAS